MRRRYRKSYKRAGRTRFARKARAVRKAIVNKRYRALRKQTTQRRIAHPPAQFARLYYSTRNKLDATGGRFTISVYLRNFAGTAAEQGKYNAIKWHERYSHVKVHKVFVKITPNVTQTVNTTSTTINLIVKHVGLVLPVPPNAPYGEDLISDSNYTYRTLMNVPGTVCKRYPKTLTLCLRPKQWVAVGQPTAEVVEVDYNATTPNVKPVNTGRYSVAQKQGWISTSSLNPDFTGKPVYDDYLGSIAYTVDNWDPTSNFPFLVEYYAYCSFKNDRAAMYFGQIPKTISDDFEQIDINDQ